MISLTSEFKLYKRGFKKILLFIPGWATDYRIYTALLCKDLLNLDYDYLLPIRFHPFQFNDKLLELLNQKSIDKISLLGWSLGGFLAAEFAFKNPDRVDELILISIRKSFNAKELEKAKSQLIRSKKAYLYKFYLECFSGTDKEGLSWFKKHLLKDYIKTMELEILVSGLDYLSCAQINPQHLSPIKKLTILHGRDDRIAPLAEAKEIKSFLPEAKFISLAGAGHLPFFARNFYKKFCHG